MSKLFAVRLARRAARDLVEIHEWIAEDSPRAAAAWLAAMRRRMGDLATLPRRCPRAREAAAPGLDLRQLVAGRHRALFVIERSTVHVLHVRHAARRDAAREDLR